MSAIPGVAKNAIDPRAKIAARHFTCVSPDASNAVRALPPPSSLSRLRSGKYKPFVSEPSEHRLAQRRAEGFVEPLGADRPQGRARAAQGRPAEGYYENFATGFWASGEHRAEVWGRPAALAVARDGALLVADDTGGTIWRISYKGPPAEHAAAPGATTGAKAETEVEGR
jgi:hypothetical protein